MTPRAGAVAILAMLLGFAAVSFAACATFTAAASDGGTDAQPSVTDAAADAAEIADASPACANGVSCGGSCNGVPDCSSCGAGKLRCAGTGICVQSCEACPSGPIECIYCDSSQANPIG